MTDIYVTGSRECKPKFQDFTVHFFGKQIRTTVTADPSVIRRWIKWFRMVLGKPKHRSIVGLGVQWRPSKLTIDYPAETLQLCVANRCLIIKLSQASSVPEILRKFLSEYKFFGIRNTMDAVKLDKSVHKLSVSTLINLEGYSRREHPSITSMQTMALDFLGLDGVRKDPVTAMSRWDARFLTKNQVQYACVDAHVSLLLAKKLLPID